jgi:predicted metal-dependent phosphoesterase TrpH
MDPEDAVHEAARLGLDAVCLTEHHALWPRDELKRLEEAAGILVLGGNEITTDQGDILVFGLRENVENVVPIAELRRRVEGDGGFMIAAHPFRGFLLFGVAQLGTDPALAASRRPVFEHVDAIEVCNGRLTPGENDVARAVSEHLGLPGTGGSDAHDLKAIGHCITVFEETIRTEGELVEALRSGKFAAQAISAG